MLSDFHLHTCVSDGELDPPTLVARAAALGIGRLAITDHDSLGAYRWGDGQVFADARSLGVELIVGTELDAVLDGKEVHILGYDLALAAAELGAHLDEAQRVRRKRARRDLERVRAHLGEDAIRDEQVFVAGRETLMRGHLIRPLVAEGHFASYEEGQAWFDQHVPEDVVVPKPTIAEAVTMIAAAGGWASLAHPGYYWKDRFPILERLPALKDLGVVAVELEYPYRSCSPEMFSEDEEREFTASLRVAGEAAGLRFTRGSDAHRDRDLERVYGPTPA
jgi:predicted metal-dependent phosphoesterase TrpH